VVFSAGLALVTPMVSLAGHASGGFGLNTDVSDRYASPVVLAKNYGTAHRPNRKAPYFSGLVSVGAGSAWAGLPCHRLLDTDLPNDSFAVGRLREAEPPRMGSQLPILKPHPVTGFPSGLRTKSHAC
jgi:hypothetical protein